MHGGVNGKARGGLDRWGGGGGTTLQWLSTAMQHGGARPSEVAALTAHGGRVPQVKGNVWQAQAKLAEVVGHAQRRSKAVS